MGPRAAPPAAMPAQMAMARARSWAGKTLVRIDSVAGMTKAPPRPITDRPAITAHVASPRAARSEPDRKISRPICRAPLRPKRSPREPPVKRKPAKTRLYASTIHCSSLVLAPSSLESVGMATFSAVLPMMTIIKLVQRTARIHQRRAKISGAMSMSAVSEPCWFWAIQCPSPD